MKQTSTLRRSPSFVPALIAHLLVNAKFSCKISHLPKSYQKQPYNLAAKLMQRGGIDARVVINVEHDFFSLIKISVKQATTKSKPKKSHVRKK